MKFPFSGIIFLSWVLLKSMRSLITLLLLITCSLKSQSQCPGSFTCEGSGVLCSIDQLNGFRCNNPTTPNAAFPAPSLCFGVGVPHNLSWWAFIGNGEYLTLTFNFDPFFCDSGQGIQAGVFEGSCDGSYIWDCNGSCNTSTFSLAGITRSCEVYYVWVDGCNGDVCTYTMSVNGNGGPATLPRHTTFNYESKTVSCRILEVGAPDFGNCQPNIEWSSDGLIVGEDERMDIEVPAHIGKGDEFEICMEVTIGNPLDPRFICDAYKICETFLFDPEERPGAMLQVPFHKQPFFWHGQPIRSSCIDPPCRQHFNIKNSECYDSLKPIELLIPDSMALLSGNVYIDLDKDCRFGNDDAYADQEIIELQSARRRISISTDSRGYYRAVVPLDTYEISIPDPVQKGFLCFGPATLHIDDHFKEYQHDFFIQIRQDCFPLGIRLKALTGRNRLRCDGRSRELSIEVLNFARYSTREDTIVVRVDSLLKWHDDARYELLDDQTLKFPIPSLSSGEKKRWWFQFDPNCTAADVLSEVCFDARFTRDRICEGQVIRARRCETILNSYDPNQLSITPHGVKAERYVERTDTLIGRIDFENEGSDTAYDIRIQLHIDPDVLDPASIQLLPKHDYICEMNVLSPSLVDFYMYDIRLPHKAIDKNNSHSNLFYSILTKRDVADWTSIQQRAAIYFDHNPPIWTNIEDQTIAGPYLFDTVIVKLCPGEFYVDSYYFESANRTDTMVMEGPDVITHSMIQIQKVYYLEQFMPLFQDEVFLGQKWDRDTLYEIRDTTIHGCDSITGYHIDVSYRDSIILQLCPGDTLNNQPIYKDTIFGMWKSGPMMDSLFVYDVQIKPTHSFWRDTFLSRGDTLWGIPIRRDTVINNLHKNRFGCDSLIQMRIRTKTTATTVPIANRVRAYPNPSQGLFEVFCDSSIDKIEVVNHSGQRLHSVHRIENVFTMDLSHLPPGVYHLVVYSGQQQSLQKLVITK